MKFKINQYGFSDFLGNLSQGLFAIGKMHNENDLEEKKMQHEDARMAAQQSFEANLARFRDQGETQRERERQQHEDTRGDKRDTVESQHWEQMHQDQQTRDANTERHQRTDEGLRGAEISDRAAERAANIKYRESAEAKNDAATKVAGQRADRQDQGELLRNKEVVARNAEDTLRQARIDGLDQTDKDAYNNLVSEVATSKKSYADAVADYEKRGGHASPTQSQAPSASLSPDRQAIYNDAIKNGDDPAAVLKKVQSMPQSQVDAVLPRLKSADTSAPPDATAAPDDGSFLPGGSAPASTAPAMAQAPAPQSPDDQTGITTPPNVDPNAAVAQAGAATPDMPQQDDGTAPDATGDQQQQADPSQRFADISDQLNQSATGQGVIATLNRLAETGDGPGADKMRRTAQIQLQQQFPDEDSNGFIDYYLDQATQEPTEAA